MFYLDNGPREPWHAFWQESERSSETTKNKSRRKDESSSKTQVEVTVWPFATPKSPPNCPLPRTTKSCWHILDSGLTSTTFLLILTVLKSTLVSLSWPHLAQPQAKDPWNKDPYRFLESSLHIAPLLHSDCSSSASQNSISASAAPVGPQGFLCLRSAFMCPSGHFV